MYKKESNSKCKATILIIYKETHQRYAYNFTLEDPFPMLVDGALQAWFGASLQVSIGSLNITYIGQKNNDLSKFSSKTHNSESL